MELQITLQLLVPWPDFSEQNLELKSENFFFFAKIWSSILSSYFFCEHNKLKKLKSRSRSMVVWDDGVGDIVCDVVSEVVCDVVCNGLYDVVFDAVCCAVCRGTSFERFCTILAVCDVVCSKAVLGFLIYDGRTKGHMYFLIESLSRLKI